MHLLQKQCNYDNGLLQFTNAQCMYSPDGHLSECLGDHRYRFAKCCGDLLPCRNPPHVHISDPQTVWVMNISQEWNPEVIWGQPILCFLLNEKSYPHSPNYFIFEIIFL